jgi:APA family basic amino acid/polyamine antiporter
MTGTLLVAVIYIAVSAVVILLIEQQELANSSAPFADLIDRYVAQGSGRWLAVFVVISGLGCLNGWTLLLGELTASMAKHGVLPRRMATYNERGAPAVALVVGAVLASAIVLMNYSKSLVEGFTLLTLIVTAANIPMYLCCALALAVFWSRHADTRSRDMVILGLLGAAYSIFAFVGIGGEPFLWSLVLAAAGIPLYLVMLSRR